MRCNIYKNTKKTQVCNNYKKSSFYSDYRGRAPWRPYEKPRLAAYKENIIIHRANDVQSTIKAILVKRRKNSLSALTHRRSFRHNERTKPIGRRRTRVVINNRQRSENKCQREKSSHYGSLSLLGLFSNVCVRLCSNEKSKCQMNLLVWRVLS